MIPDEARFIWDIESLQEIARYPGTKNLIDASGILRRLLLDKECLVHKISRKLDVKPTFRVSGGSSKQDMLDFVQNMPFSDRLTHLYINPDPSIEVNGTITEVGLDQFIASAMNFTSGKVITVKEIVLYVANVGGGVHKGKPRSADNAELIHENIDQLMINGNFFPVESVKNVINITINGLLPFYWRLKS